MHRRILSLLLAVVMLLTALVMAVPAAAETTTLPLKTKGYQLRVHASNTANGQSTVYLLKDGTFIIFDGGGSASDANHLKAQLQSIAEEHGLDKNNVVISLWVFTHPHGDHVGFLNSWATYKSGVTVKQVWYNPTDWAASAASKIPALFSEATVKAVHAGEEYDFADVHIKVLWAADDTNKEHYDVDTYGVADYDDYYGTLKSGTTSRADQNNASTILKMTVYNTTVLMGGDAGYEPFEWIYNNKYASVGVTREDLDCDIFQVTHHGVGSANTKKGGDLVEYYQYLYPQAYPAAVYSTPNNKHFAVMTPHTIIVPAGRNVVNMVLDGTRAIKSSNVEQKWDDAPKNKDYDGYYRLYMDFGIIDAVGGAGKTIADEAAFSKVQTGDKDGKSYYLAGWLDPNDALFKSDIATYAKTKGRTLFFEAENVAEDLSIEMLDGAAARCVPDGASGIRFLSNVPVETLKNAEALLTAGAISGYSFGTVIFKASSVSKLNGEISVAALEAAGEQYVDIAAKNGVRENKDGSKTISAALVNIKEKNYGLNLAAVSYIEVTFSNGYVARVYSAFDKVDNVRSIAVVARRALADVSDVQKTEVQDGVYYLYSHLITDPTDEFYGKYSLYTEAQRAVLRKYAQANDDTLAGFDRDDVGTDIWD